MRYNKTLIFCLCLLNSGCVGGGLFEAPASLLGGSSLSSIVLPTAPHSLLSLPISPSNTVTPTVSGTTEPLCHHVEVFSGHSCSGSVLATGTADAIGAFSLPVSALPEGTHNLSVKCTDSSSNSNCSSTSLAYVVDQTGPLISLSAPSTSLVNSASHIVYTATYSDPNVINLVTGQVALVTTGGATCNKAVNVTGPNTADVTLSNCSGNGTVGFSINAGSAVDALGNNSPASPVSATFVVDNSGIASGSMIPPAGDFSSLPSSLVFHFPEAIDPSSVDASDISFGGTCAGVSVSGISVSGTNATVSLAGTSGCLLMETFNIIVDMTGMHDLAGNAGVGNLSGVYRFNNVGPTSAVFGPIGAAINPIPASVDVTFNQPIDPSSVDASDFVITGTCAGVSVGGVSASGSLASVSLSGVGGCAHGQTVILTANFAGIQDLSANAGSGSSAATFTLDNVGPVSLLSQSSGIFSVLPTSVVATFDADTDMSSVSGADVSLSGTCAVASLGAVNKVGQTATIHIDGTIGCVSGQTVIVGVDHTSIVDNALNAGVGSVSSTFTLDNLGPSALLAISTGSLNVFPASVAVTFDADTNMATVTAADFTVGGTCGVTLGSVVKVANVATLNLTGTAGCTTGQTLTLAANLAGVSDATGNAGSGSSTATLTLDTVGPSAVLGLTSGSYNPLPTSVAVTFPSDVTMSSVTAADFSLSGTCPTASIGSVSKLGQIATVNLSGTGSCPSLSTMILTANLTGVVDNAGNSGVGSQAATYLLDDVGPLSSFSVATGSYNPLPTSVAVTFSADTNMASVTAADFSLTGTCATDSIGSVNKAGQVATVNLSGTALCGSMTTSILSVNLAGVSDTLGNAGSGSHSATYTFDNVGPGILIGISTGIYNPLPTSVDIEFDTDTDMSTVTAADFILTGTCGGASISSVTKVANIARIHFSGTAGCGFLSTMILTTGLMGVTDQVGNVGIGLQLATYTKGI